MAQDHSKKTDGPQLVAGKARREPAGETELQQQGTIPPPLPPSPAAPSPAAPSPAAPSPAATASTPAPAAPTPVPASSSPSAPTTEPQSPAGPGAAKREPAGPAKRELLSAALASASALSAATASAPPGSGTPAGQAPSASESEAKEPHKRDLPPREPPARNQPRGEPASEEPAEEREPASERRAARRRPAGPPRERIAANDDAPSIGGLIYALNQKPSKRAFLAAVGFSGVWALLVLAFAAAYWGLEIFRGAGFAAVAVRPEFLTMLATLFGPVVLAFSVALVAWRAEELRLRSSAMTEVAVRLAEPDRMAEQSIASLGQSVRRQVSFMNDAVVRALGRAGELEALVHSEVASLERAYEENERRIRSLIQELAGERDALVNTSDRVTDTLRTMGSEVPALIEKLSTQQIKLAQIIEGAGQNLIALETAIGKQTGNLENSLGSRTEHLQNVLEQYTSGLSQALDARTDEMRAMFDGYEQSINESIAGRTEGLQVVFEEYARALDTTLANRSQALDMQLVERTRALDEAFSERLRLFDESMLRSTMAIDSTLSERALAINTALERHSQALGQTLTLQANEIDESLMQGISAVRRTSENITRQSMQAIEGLAGQSELLKSVSENLLSQISGITTRIDSQGQQFMRAANALESANFKIDKTLQVRHAELTKTLEKLSGKADELGSVVHGYSAQIEGSIGEAERRARSLTAELATTAEERSRATLAEIERLKASAETDTTRALEDLRARFSNVSREVTQSLGSLGSQFTETSSDVRQRAAQAAADLASEQERLRQQIDALPRTTRESSDALRRSLQDQLRALDQLSSLTARQAHARDIARPAVPPSQHQQTSRALVPISGPQSAREEAARAALSLAGALSQELQSRTRGSAPSQPAPAQPAPGPTTDPVAAAIAAAASDPRDAWSLGDLLKRASLDDDPAQAGAAQRQSAQKPPAGAAALPPQALDIAALARALDPATAADIWTRLGAGQRGIMVRSIYSAEGRATFDETVRRYQTDASFQSLIGQFLNDFERTLQDTERQDPSGRSGQAQLMSEFGRAYLVLAHISGRVG